MNLSQTTLRNINLNAVAIHDANLERMTLNDVFVTDLFEAYAKCNRQPGDPPCD